MRTVVVVIALAAFTLAHAGPSPATRCTAAKEKAAGKKIAGKMACHAKAKSTGTTVDAACLVKAEAKFVASFARLGVACPGDAASVEVLVDSCVGALVGDVPGDGKCQKASAESIGKWARRLMRCATRDL